MGHGILALAPLLMRHPIGIVVLLVIIGGSIVTGMFGTRDNDAPQVTQTTGATVNDEGRQFVGYVLDDAQKTWQQVFAKGGRQYRNAKLVLFSEATSTACGYGQAATGPFYCPSDERVYIDLSFYDDLARRFGAKGDFAQAYVIAHEIGHHVQNLVGIERQVRQLQQARPGQANALSVRMELQADCFAGLWGHTTARRNLLEPGDVEEGLQAAASIGDDAIQQSASGRVRPETFTHGTAAQRVEWLRRGLQASRVEDCDTFSAQ